MLRCDDGKLHIVYDQQCKLKKRANGINIDWDITMLPCSHTQLTENKKGSVFAAVLHISVILKNFSGIFFGSTTMEGEEEVYGQITPSSITSFVQ